MLPLTFITSCAAIPPMTACIGLMLPAAQLANCRKRSSLSGSSDDPCNARAIVTKLSASS